MAEPERIDWPGLMRIGLGQLRLAPDEFWAMTPVEFRCAMEGAGLVPIGGQALGRSHLRALIAAFPDRIDGGET